MTWASVSSIKLLRLRCSCIPPNTIEYCILASLYCVFFCRHTMVFLMMLYQPNTTEH